MALTLERLYRDFGDDGELTVAEYESLGGMARVVQTEVDSVLDADPEQRQAQLETLQMRSSRGWPPSTPTATSPCAAWPAGTTCPPPATP